MAQITYANKEALNEIPEIADINKVRDVDMNEIKDVVNTNYNNTIQTSNTQPTDNDCKFWFNTTTNELYMKVNGSFQLLDIGSLASIPVGTIAVYPSDTVPEGYMICDGSAISRTIYSTLFSIIGTTYGSGDGSTTFNLPNLKGKVVVGKDSNDSDFDTLGETGGEKTHTLTIDEMPSHTHAIPYETNSKGAGDGYDWGGPGNFGGVDSGSAGGGQAHNNLQPYIVLNYIIKVSETTPTISQVVNTRSNSTEDTYACDYSNKAFGGVELYGGSSGTASTISLSDDPSNYSVLEIFFKNSNNEGNDSVRVPYNINNIDLVNTEYSSTSSTLYIKMAVVKFGTSTLTFVSNQEVQISAGSVTSSNGNFIFITKVVGYK